MFSGLAGVRHVMIVLLLSERKSWDCLVACDVVVVAYDLHEVVVDEPGVIGAKVEMVEECLRIDIPYPVHTLAMFPCLAQVAGTVGASVVVFPGPVVG